MRNPSLIVTPQNPQPQPPVVSEPQVNTTPPKNYTEMKVTPNRHSTSGFDYVKEDVEDNTHIKQLRSQLRRELRGLWINASSRREVDSTTGSLADMADFSRKPTDEDDEDDDEEIEDDGSDDGDPSHTGPEEHVSLRMHLAHRLRRQFYPGLPPSLTTEHPPEDLSRLNPEDYERQLQQRIDRKSVV